MSEQPVTGDVGEARRRVVDLIDPYSELCATCGGRMYEESYGDSVHTAGHNFEWSLRAGEHVPAPSGRFDDPPEEVGALIEAVRVEENDLQLQLVTNATIGWHEAIARAEAAERELVKERRRLEALIGVVKDFLFDYDNDTGDGPTSDDWNSLRRAYAALANTSTSSMA